MIWVVRHGVSEMGLQGRFSGHNPSPLAEEGVAQAQRAGRWLRRAIELYAPGQPCRLVSSSVRRAADTASLIAGELGLLVAESRADLAETDLGGWDGLTPAEIRESWPDEFARWRSDDHASPPGGESWMASAHRAVAAFDEVAKGAREDELVIVVSHSNPIKALLAAATVGRGGVLIRSAHLDFAATSRFRFDAAAGEWQLQSWNEVPDART